MKRPKMKYRPSATKGNPKSANGTGAPPTRAEISQKIAKPPQSRLKGTMKTSLALKCFAGSGRPVHSKVSSGSR